jgi:hypothetical protein
VLPSLVPPTCPAAPPYDFLADLDDPERATVFGAVKALGFLPQIRAVSEGRLTDVMANHSDPLIRLEAAGSLARLGVASGWNDLRRVAAEHDDERIRMEATLILSELGGDAVLVLTQLANDADNPSELRSAAVWGIGEVASQTGLPCLLDAVVDADEDTALHAIVALSRLVTDQTIDTLLAVLGNERSKSAAIVRAVQLSSLRPVERVVEGLRAASGERREWLLYLLASFGRAACEPLVRMSAPDLLPRLDFHWMYHVENWTNRLYVADRLDFLMAQIAT